MKNEAKLYTHMRLYMSTINLLEKIPPFIQQQLVLGEWKIGVRE